MGPTHLLEGEKFLLIHGASRYEVSNLGRVRRRSRDNSRWIIAGISTGKVFINMDDGTADQVSLKRLVAETFISPPPPKGTWIRFRDGNPRNCCVDNLVIGGDKNMTEVFRQEADTLTYFTSDQSRVVIRISDAYYLVNYQKIDFELLPPNDLGQVKGRIR